MKHTIIAKDKEHLTILIKEHIEKYGEQCSLNHIDVFRVTDMKGLFRFSNFNGSISKWNVSNVKDMRYIFYNSKFKGDISKWDVANVEEMSFMFCLSQFNQDLTSWKPTSLKFKDFIFDRCPAPIPYWAKVKNTPQAVEEYLIKLRYDEMSAVLENNKNIKKGFKI